MAESHYMSNLMGEGPDGSNLSNNGAENAVRVSGTPVIGGCGDANKMDNDI
jgi:hypothetical protein